MKKIVFIITALTLLTLSSCVVAQSIHQEEIVSFIDKNVGKKVGSGICADLVIYACKQWDNNWKFTKTEKGLGAPVTYDELQPGDIILTSGEVDLDGHVLPSHVMIAYQKKSDDSWLIADQNAGSTLAESKVRISEFDEQVWIDGSKRIVIRYFRLQ